MSTGLGEAVGAQDQVRILGITAPNRVKDVPNVPTLKEQGYNVTFKLERFFRPSKYEQQRQKAVAKLLGDVQTPEWKR